MAPFPPHFKLRWWIQFGTRVLRASSFLCISLIHGVMGCNLLLCFLQCVCVLKIGRKKPLIVVVYLYMCEFQLRSDNKNHPWQRLRCRLHAASAFCFVIREKKNLDVRLHKLYNIKRGCFCPSTFNWIFFIFWYWDKMIFF